MATALAAARISLATKSQFQVEFHGCRNGIE